MKCVEIFIKERKPTDYTDAELESLEKIINFFIIYGE